VQTILKVSEAGWALAKRRERVLSTLAESKECSRAMMQKHAPRSNCRGRWCFGFWPDTGKIAGLALCFCTHADESVEVEGSEKSRSRSLLRRSARSLGRSGRMLPYTERSPQLVENADFRFPPMGPRCEGFKPMPTLGGLPEPLGWLAVYCLLAKPVYTLTVNTE
jgi:hypothetical protein